MVLAQKQTQRSMEEYGESRNKSEVILSNSSTTKARIYSRGKKNSFLSKWCWENRTAT